MRGVSKHPAAGERTPTLQQQARQNPKLFIRTYFFSSGGDKNKVAVLPKLVRRERYSVAQVAADKGLSTGSVWHGPKRTLVIGHQQEAVYRKIAELRAVSRKKVQEQKLERDRKALEVQEKKFARELKAEEAKRKRNERDEKLAKEPILRNLNVEKEHKAFVRSHTGLLKGITGVWKVMCPAIAILNPKYSGNFDMNLSFPEPERWTRASGQDENGEIDSYEEERRNMRWGSFNFGVLEGVFNLKNDPSLTGNSVFDWRARDGDEWEDEFEDLRDGHTLQGRGHLSLITPTEMKGVLISSSLVAFKLKRFEFQALQVSVTPSSAGEASGCLWDRMERSDSDTDSSKLEDVDEIEDESNLEDLDEDESIVDDFPESPCDWESGYMADYMMQAEDEGMSFRKKEQVECKAIMALQDKLVEQYDREAKAFHASKQQQQEGKTTATEKVSRKQTANISRLKRSRR